VKKNELIDVLIDALKLEENAISVYSKHLIALSTRFQVDKAYIEEIKKTLSFLIQEEKKHKKICAFLINKVTKDQKNDY